MLWDLDGTLVDSEPVHGMAFYRAIKELDLKIPENNEIDLLGKSEVDVLQVVLEIGGNLSLSVWRKLKWRHYLAVSNNISVIGDVVEIIEELTAVGFDNAVVSNSNREILNLNLSVVGLDKYFDVSISRDDVKNGKPAPEGYLTAASRLGFEPGECAVVEDSIPGATAGIDAGMTTILAPQFHLPMEQIPEGVTYLSPDDELSKCFQKLAIIMRKNE